MKNNIGAWQQHWMHPVFLLSCLSLGYGAWCGIGGSVSPARAESVEGVAPPAIYPARTWQGRSQSVIRILNRVDSRLSILTLNVGEKVQYRGLTIQADACLERPPTLPGDAATYLTIEEVRPSPGADSNGKLDDKAVHSIFNGWFLLGEPALGGYVSPLYTISVVSCQGDAVPPMAGPLPVPSVPDIAVLASFESVASHISGGEDDLSGVGKEGAAAAPPPGRSSEMPPSGPSPLPPPVPARQSTLSDHNNGQEFQEDWMQDNAQR